VALRIFLDGDMAALAAYHVGDRTNPLVRPYFERAGCGALLHPSAGKMGTAGRGSEPSVSPTFRAQRAVAWIRKESSFSHKNQRHWGKIQEGNQLSSCAGEEIKADIKINQNNQNTRHLARRNLI